MKYDERSIGNNFKNTILEGKDAVLAAVMTLITIPYGRLPEVPFDGFDINDLLWHSTNNDTSKLDSLIEEFKTKIENTCDGANVLVSITTDVTFVDIKIDYINEDGERESIPIRLEDDNGRIRRYYRDIEV